ncbi:hypothetical protein [Rhizobium sp. Leaf386]|uniref:hypothetical protein n=1 Tax=Rhizobium sp. Leaf386 TaxID=1736359 RepID=UPI000A886881|nr:hypothetical protein [Rhizobium sp. Leaf386]
MSEIEHQGVVAMAAESDAPDVPRVFIRWATGEDGSLRIRKWSQFPHDGAVAYEAAPSPHDHVVTLEHLPTRSKPPR